MGRVKLAMKRIVSNRNRQNTFSKRRNGLIKKAYELATLCDINLALIIFSPSDRLNFFSHNGRIEHILSRYINLSDPERRRTVVPSINHENWDIQNKESILRNIEKVRKESEVTNRPILLELQQEIGRLTNELQLLQQQIRSYEQNLLHIKSMIELELWEKKLEETLVHIIHRKEYLQMDNLASISHNPSIIESGMPTYLENEIVMPWRSDNLHYQSQDFNGRDFSNSDVHGTSSNSVINDYLSEFQLLNFDDDNYIFEWSKIEKLIEVPNCSSALVTPIISPSIECNYKEEYGGIGSEMTAVMASNEGPQTPPNDRFCVQEERDDEDADMSQFQNQ